MILLRLVSVGLLLVNVGRLHEAAGRLTGALPLAKALLAVGLVALVLSSPWVHLTEGLRTRPAKAFGFFALAILISLPFSYYKGASLEIATQFLFAVLPIVVITLAGIRRIDDLESLFRATTLMVVISAALLAAGVGTVGDARITLTGSYDPNDLALVMATCLPFCVWALRDRYPVWRAAGLAGLVGGTFVIIKTGSRGAFVALLVQLLLVVFVIRKSIPNWLRLATVPAFALAIALAPQQYRERMMTLTSLSEDYNTSALGGRQEIWKRGVGYFLDRPLNGVGIGQFMVAEGKWGQENGYTSGWKWSAPHNMYIEAAAELGALGIGSLLVFLWSVLKFTKVTSQLDATKADTGDSRRGSAAAAIFLATGTFAVGAVFVTAALSPVFMMLVSYAIGFEVISRKRRSAKSVPGIRDRRFALGHRQGTVYSRYPSRWPS